MTEKKSTQKILNWKRNKGTTEAGSQLECFTCDFPPFLDALTQHTAVYPHTSMGWPGHYSKLFLVVTQSKAKLLKHWSGSVSMPMSASLIYSEKPTADYKSNHKRQNPLNIQKLNTLRLAITLSRFRGIHSFVCRVRHSRHLSSRSHSRNIETILVVHYAINQQRVRIFLKNLRQSQFSHSVISDYLRPHGLQHARLPCPSPTPRACSNSRHRVGNAIQPFHPLSSLSPPAFNLSTGSFPMSQFFASGGPSIGVSASASVLPMNIQD